MGSFLAGLFVSWVSIKIGRAIGHSEGYRKGWADAHDVALANIARRTETLKEKIEAVDEVSSFMRREGVRVEEN